MGGGGLGGAKVEVNRLLGEHAEDYYGLGCWMYIWGGPYWAASAILLRRRQDLK